jgi:hypothetical protein
MEDEPEFLGKSFVLENAKFWKDKNNRTIEMESHMYIGCTHFIMGKWYHIDELCRGGDACPLKKRKMMK